MACIYLSKPLIPASGTMLLLSLSLERERKYKQKGKGRPIYIYIYIYAAQNMHINDVQFTEYTALYMDIQFIPKRTLFASWTCIS